MVLGCLRYALTFARKSNLLPFSDRDITYTADDKSTNLSMYSSQEELGPLYEPKL